jgi:hypothetical protein
VASAARVPGPGRALPLDSTTEHTRGAGPVLLSARADCIFVRESLALALVAATPLPFLAPALMIVVSMRCRAAISPEAICPFWAAPTANCSATAASCGQLLQPTSRSTTICALACGDIRWNLPPTTGGSCDSPRWFLFQKWPLTLFFFLFFFFLALQRAVVPSTPGCRVLLLPNDFPYFVEGRWWLSGSFTRCYLRVPTL